MYLPFFMIKQAAAALNTQFSLASILQMQRKEWTFKMSKDVVNHLLESYP